MKKRLEKRGGAPPWWRGLLLRAAIFAFVLTLVLLGIEKTRRGVRAQELALVERAVNRAVIACYAMEGFYPPTIDYLVDNYGLAVDREKYYIQHEAFAPNIYPAIWVARR